MRYCRACSCFKVLFVVACLVGAGWFVHEALTSDAPLTPSPVVTEAAAPVQPVFTSPIDPTPAQPQVAAPATPPAQAVAPSIAGTTYKVQKGDTLWDLAERAYGDPTLYMKIFNANDKVLWDPDRIYVGQTLNIPAR